MLFPRVAFLKEDEQLLLQSFTRKSIKNGPGIFFIRPFLKAVKRKGITLSPTEYIRMRDNITGDIRVEKGPNLIFLNANEEIIQGPSKGIYIDEHTAVIIRNIQKGSLRLITDKQVFFPGDHEEIEHIVKKILLEKHESVIIKDKDGNFRIVSGETADNAFFLNPFEELLTLEWSSGIHKDARELVITHIDSRPKFMWYEFDVRTRDNVELILGITFFWQIVDVEKMISSTDDAPGDVCSHARSMIIQSISKSILENFLGNFNDIIKQCIIGEEDVFYSTRGVKIHSVEVRSISCKSESTQSILEEIIQETTTRLNKLQKQESENEIEVNKVKGKIETEKRKSELLEIERENKKQEAMIMGESEAFKVKKFFDTLGSDISQQDKINIFNTLKKEEYIDKLSKGNAKLFFTPRDIDLSIETKSD